MFCIQVVVASDASLRVSAPETEWTGLNADTFGNDMPQPVPLSRWDIDNPSLLFLGSKASARFAGFMSGELL